MYQDLQKKLKSINKPQISFLGPFYPHLTIYIANIPRKSMEGLEFNSDQKTKDA